MSDLPLEGRVALVTNVNHFVGDAAATALADAGATVVCHDAAFAQAAPRRAWASRHDRFSATPEQDPHAVVAGVLAEAGHLDVLVCNDAHPAVRARVEEAALEDLRAALEAMTVAPFAFIGAAAPHMKARRSGKIVLVTSAAPLKGLANYAMYCTARGATNALTLSLARELAPANINVNAVAPNFIESPSYFPAELLADPRAREKIERQIPLGRIGQPEEVGALIAFLAGPGSDFITGQVMPVTGGWA